MFPQKITRYILWELAKIFAISSFGFVGMMVIIGVVQKASDPGIGPEIVLKLIPFILPEALMFAMPATCLLSVCVVYGKMSSDNELIAVKSMGLHPSVLVMPTLFATFLLSLAAVWINDISFAWSYWGIERVVLESSDQIVYGILRNEGSFRTESFSIEVQGVEGRNLIRPEITFKKKEDTIRVVANQAMIEAEPENHSLVFTMIQGSAFNDQGSIRYVFPEADPEIQLKKPEQIAKATGNPSHLYLSQIEEELKIQENANRQMHTENSVRACGQILSGNMMGLSQDSWEIRDQDLNDSKKRLIRLKLVPHRRWANGFSCLAFAIIGIPIATRLKTANYASTFGVCFLPILLIYYPLFMFGLTAAKTGALPAIAVWFGNVVCTLIGICLLWREYRS
ncbi:MAG: LptF/LptG family permease [Planctomycetota bacterium]